MFEFEINNTTFFKMYFIVNPVSLNVLINPDTYIFLIKAKSCLE